MHTIRYFFYGLLGLPLAMVALPVYVQIPAYYTTQFHLPLASTGLVLFFARLIDTVQDPFLGQLIDRFQLRMRTWFCAGAIILIAAFYGLWLPPTAIHSNPNYLLLWLSFMLIFTYSAHSMLNIAYLAWGARIQPNIATHVQKQEQEQSQTTTQEELLKVSAWREVLGIVGVVMASMIPSWIILGEASATQSSLQLYVAGFSLILILAIFALLFGAPAWSKSKQEQKSSLKEALTDKPFRHFLPIYFINSLSVAIPASLILFFINDQIKAPEYAGHFLAIYFIAGAIGLPFWLSFAKKKGPATAWKLGMVLAVMSFIGAAFLGNGNVQGFFIICIASGLALGADLCLPPVLLANIIPAEKAAASYFGVWTLLAKFALAVAGLSLPLLSFLNYQPGQITSNSSHLGLVITYALIPCVLKITSLVWLQHYTKAHLQTHSHSHQSKDAS